MAHEEELKKWKALEHICVCFLPPHTVKKLDILLNPRKCMGSDWTKVAEALGYQANGIQHLSSLMKSHGSQFQNMLEDYKDQERHSVLEFVQALYATGRQDVRDAIKNTYEDVKTLYHQFKHTEAAKYSCYPDHVKTLQCGNVHCSSHPHHQSPRCDRYSNSSNCHMLYQQYPHYPATCLHQQALKNPCLRYAKHQPMDVDMDATVTPLLPTGTDLVDSQPVPHVESYNRVVPKQQVPVAVTMTNEDYYEGDIEMKPYHKSNYGLEHPPYTPVPGVVRATDMAAKENQWTLLQNSVKKECDRKDYMAQNVDTVQGYGDLEEHKDTSLSQSVGKAESMVEMRQTSGDSSESAKSKRYTFPACEKSDSLRSEHSDQLRGYHSTESRLETAPFTQAIKEVFLTYPDDKPVMKYVFQLLDNLQQNKFKTSADEKDRAETIPEKIIKRFKRSDFVIVCISPKYKEQINLNSPINFINKAEKLHTAELYEMMQDEVSQNGCNDRFIPVLLSGACKKDVPRWLRQICPPEIIYEWPGQYKSLLFHLLEPQKLVERYQRSMRDMSKRSLQFGDRRSGPKNKQPKYNSSG